MYNIKEVHVDEITHAYSTEEKAHKKEEENVVVESISYQDTISAL
jgi:hypothetical protein